jgi:hypothetical protein
MKDCTTFLKLQEAALNKQTKAKRQGYEGNNKPPTSQQGNNGAPQGQDQPSQGRDDDGGYVPSKGHITAMIQPVPKLNKEEKKHYQTSQPSSYFASSYNRVSTLVRTTNRIQ